MESVSRCAGDPFFLWKLLPDPRRPELPYHGGLSLRIRGHTPPAPFGPGYYKGPECQECPPQPIREVTQSEWCLQHPPADTRPPADLTVHNLRVVDELACEDGRGPQVFRCHLDQDESTFYVARIYHALYYSYADRSFGTAVDKAGVDGLFAPKYYGSWIFDLTLTDLQTTRPVRMTLMEWIPGSSLQSLVDTDRVYRVAPDQRRNILAIAMEVESKIAFHGVRHDDFAPRNTILVPCKGDLDDAPRVLLVDFNNSIALGRPNSKYKRPEVTLPLSLMYLYWPAFPNDFHLWAPEPHRSRRAAFKGWLKCRWENSTEFTLRPKWWHLDRLDSHEPVEMVHPLPDVKPAPFSGLLGLENESTPSQR
ncbi:hypothetical protein CDD83_2642 [Cordyceps sp. RAO-2017]|nr:hypothetical protein CDD83_2642 [Cordyceps sp. RAO-2017]